MVGNELADVRAVLRAAAQWGRTEADVAAVGLAGSWARCAARPDSDIDLIVLTRDSAALLRRTDWFAAFGKSATLVRSADFRAVQERRLALQNGTIVEVGIAATQWASTAPVDSGTRRVVEDGFVVVFDPDAVLARLVASIEALPLPDTNI